MSRPKFKNIKLTATRLASRLLKEATRGQKTRKAKLSSRKEAFRRISIDLLHKAQIPIDETTSPRESGVTWDGSKLFTKSVPGTNLVHELAHFQVAPIEWLGTPEFGLGIGPDADGKVAKKRFNYPTDSWWSLPWNKRHSQGVEEELKASLLGILWERQYDCDWWTTFVDHSWIGWEGTEDPKSLLTNSTKFVWEQGSPDVELAWLMSRGYINGVGNPNLVFSNGLSYLPLDPNEDGQKAKKT